MRGVDVQSGKVQIPGGRTLLNADRHVDIHEPLRNAPPESEQSLRHIVKLLVQAVAAYPQIKAAPKAPVVILIGLRKNGRLKVVPAELPHVYAPFERKQFFKHLPIFPSRAHVRRKLAVGIRRVVA